MADIVLVAGPSGSGKSTVWDKVSEKIQNACVLKEDFYYIPLRPDEDAATHNFDIPSSLDWERFVEDVKKLKNGESIDAPIYDFVTHSRKGTQKIEPKKLIIIEGILLFTCEELRNLSTLLVYVDADQITCFLRRMKRDKEERGRTEASVIKQYTEQVGPAFKQYVEPSSKFANITIHNGTNGVYTGMTMLIKYFEAIYA